MSEHGRYGFESFCAHSADFHLKFSSYLSEKHGGGFEYIDCRYETIGDKTYARCLFKKK